jgi:hypothetical protein
MPVADRFQRKLPRLLKFARRRVVNAAFGSPSSRPVFVLGAQRSGTRLPLLVLERNRDVIAYNEGSAPFFDGVLLRDDATVRSLVAGSPFPVVILKPICESHRGGEFLDGFEDSKVVWIFRHYYDTVRSATQKWSGALDNLRPLARGDLRAAGWRAGGLSEEQLALVRSLFSEQLPPEGAHALMYYLRNSLFFDQGLDRRPAVRLVKYEDLATSPARVFPELFQFLNCAFEQRFLDGVYGSSVRKGKPPGIPAEIEALCETVYQRLSAAYAGTTGDTPVKQDVTERRPRSTPGRAQSRAKLT